MSEYVTVKNSPEQGYVLAQLLFIALYAAVLLAASGSRSEGSCFNYFTGGSIANLERCQAKSKVREVLSANVLFAADSVLGVQNITDGFDCTAMAQPCHKQITLTFSRSMLSQWCALAIKCLSLAGEILHINHHD